MLVFPTDESAIVTVRKVSLLSSINIWLFEAIRGIIARPTKSQKQNLVLVFSVQPTG
jgi:hypothetical protein